MTFASTDIRIDYPADSRSADDFAADIESLLHDNGITPQRVCDMPSHLIITINTEDLLDTATAMKAADML